MDLSQSSVSSRHDPDDDYTPSNEASTSVPSSADINRVQVSNTTTTIGEILSASTDSSSEQEKPNFVLEGTISSQKEPLLGHEPQEHSSHGGNLPPAAPHRDTPGYHVGNNPPKIRNIVPPPAQQAAPSKTEHFISEHPTNTSSNKHPVLQGTVGLTVQPVEKLIRKRFYGSRDEPPLQAQ